MYYSSIDHSTWGSVQFGSGTATKVQYGDGSTDYSADRTNLQSYQATLSAEIMGDILTANKELVGVQEQVVVEEEADWTDGGTTWGIDIRRLMPQGDDAGFLRGRPHAVAAMPSKTTPADGDENVAFPPASTDSVTVTKTNLANCRTAIETIIGRIDFTGRLGTWPVRTWATLHISDDCQHIWWDDDPTYLSSVSVTSWGLSPVTVDVQLSGNQLGRSDYAIMVLYRTTAGDWVPDSNGWISAPGTSEIQGGSVVGSLQDEVCVVVGLKMGTDWVPCQYYYKLRA